MKILIVSATKAEILPFLSQNKKAVDVLVTGVGMVNTVFHLTQKLLNTKYDWVINAGVAGSFDKTIPLGTVCRVQQDFFSEIGFENPDGTFSSFLGSSLFPENEILFSENNSSFHSSISSLPVASGITVNTVHGNETSIEKLQNFLHSSDKFQNTILESMEGAAVFYVCQKMQAKAVQLRAVSNYVENRDLEKWNMLLAIQNLNDFLLKIID